MAMTTTITTTTKVPKFLRCLYDILHFEDQTILAWSYDGTHFQVRDVSRLERDVLPRYFKHSKFTSFQRQLNNFGFHKWTKTRANVCTFSHETLVQCHPGHLNVLIVSMTSVIEQADSIQIAVLKRELEVAPVAIALASDAKMMKTSSENEPTLNLDFDVDELLTLIATDMLLASLDYMKKEHSETLVFSLVRRNADKEAMLEPLTIQISCERNRSELDLVEATDHFREELNVDTFDVEV